ncbi:MAG: hypothetical protein NXI04_18860 [Planctomycetaceae bacterium]|nr:hypothetical protein [Planctomycetaceae bacterium]
MVETPDPMPEFSPPERPRIPNVSSRRPGTVTCATNQDGYEAIYINGKFIAEQMTFYMSELVREIEQHLAAGVPVRIHHMAVSNIEWPPFTDGLIEKGGAE